MQSKVKQKTDKELWDLLRKNNKTAFSLLYQRHIKALFNFGLKFTSNRDLIKDVLQELFTDFWNKRTSLAEVEHVKVYLIKSFRYQLLKAISNSNKSKIYRLEDLLKDVPENEILENEIAFERRLKLKEKLLHLPERQREVIHLKYFQNLKNEEIAEIINVNYQSVANLLHRAIKNLKKRLIQNKTHSINS